MRSPCPGRRGCPRSGPARRGLVVVLVVFGPKNLPKLGSSLGKTVKNFRDGMGEGDEALAKAQVAKADAEAAIDDPDDEDA